MGKGREAEGEDKAERGRSPTNLQIFWCSFSCSSMKLSYRSLVKVMFRRTAATAKGRTLAVWKSEHQQDRLALGLSFVKTFDRIVVAHLTGPQTDSNRHIFM